MNDARLFTTVETLTRIAFPLLYVLTGLIVYRVLMPRFSPICKRIAAVFLAAQVFIIGNALYVDSSSSFYDWLWDLHREWNVSATFASTQLALVAGVALLTALLARARPAWLRLYFVGIGLVFLYLACDEYFTLHEYRISWKYYVSLGAAVVLTTLVAAAFSPRRSWKWHLCLLSGLAIGAAGAIQVEQFGSLCGDYGWLYVADCPRSTVWALEEIFEFLGIWLALVAVLGQLSDELPVPPLHIRRVITLMPLLWIAVLIPSAMIWPIARQVGGEPAAVDFESGASLRAYQLNNRTRHLTIRLFLSPERWDYNGLGYSINLVDQASGDSIVSLDTHAHRRLEFYLAPEYVPVYRQWKRIPYPPQTPVNRAMWIALKLWHEHGGEYIGQQVLSSDLRLLSDTQVVLGELVLPAESTIATSEPAAFFDNGFSLDTVDLPNTAEAGENLEVEFTWRSDVQGSDDHVQFLHLGHAESGEWWGYDQQPLGARLPTRLWYSGLADSETWQVPLPADLAPGRYEVFTGLYRVSDQERAPVADDGGRPWLDNRVALGELMIDG